MTNNLQAWSGGSADLAIARGRSAAERAEYYRRKAAQLRQMAEWEPLRDMQERLHKLAREYDQLVERLHR